MDENIKYDDTGECNSPLRSSVGAIVRGFKSSVTKQIRLIGFDKKLWQRNYHDHIIRNEQSYLNIANYIINNPAKWEEDKFYKT
jgi:REP element-mobilizing transposase RayT